MRRLCLGLVIFKLVCYKEIDKEIEMLSDTEQWEHDEQRAMASKVREEIRETI